MSFINVIDASGETNIWDLPGTTPPPEIQTWTGDPDAVDGTDPNGVQVGGVNKIYVTSLTPPGTSQNIVLSGENNQLIVGPGDANVQVIGGGNIVESVQVLGDGTKVISTGAFGNVSQYDTGTTQVTTDVVVNGNIIGETATIAEAAGGMLPEAGFQNYAHGSTGNDIIYGSTENDFFRGGMGNDTIYAFAGNDLVRGGDGSDEFTLGSGIDTIYYTQDQLLGGDNDVVKDFGLNGEADKLAVDQKTVADFNKFGGFGTNVLSIQDSNGNTTTVQAQAGYQWKQADIFFVV